VNDPLQEIGRRQAGSFGDWTRI